MGGRVDARDVLDPNARTRRAFRGRVVGHYRPTGPNAWDDYEFVVQDEGEIDVLPDLEIQLELRGPRFRMRQQGRVIRVQWEPASLDLERLATDDVNQRRELFIAGYVLGYREAKGQEVASVVRKLKGSVD